MHTYIIGHYNPSVQDYDLASFHIVYFNSIHECLELQCKVDSKRQIFEELFMPILFTFRVFVRNLLRGSGQRNIFLGFNRGFTYNKPTHHLLDQGNFDVIVYRTKLNTKIVLFNDFLWGLQQWPYLGCQAPEIFFFLGNFSCQSFVFYSPKKYFPICERYVMWALNRGFIPNKSTLYLPFVGLRSLCLEFIITIFPGSFLIKYSLIMPSD